MTSISCTDIFGPHLPDGAIALHPVPTEYEGWWAIAERCSGVEGNLDDVSWYVSPGVTSIPDSDDAVGQYQRGRHRIVLAEAHVRDGFTVRHEMIHALLRGGGHPRALFLEQCGAVVGCGEGCEAEAGTRPIWNLESPLASEEDLEVSVELFPSTVSLSGDSQGCLSIGVNVTNVSVASKTVDVRRGRAFSWILDDLGGGSGGGPILVDSLIVVEPQKSWMWIADCPHWFQGGVLAPGQYSIRGRLERGPLGQLTSEPVSLTVVP